MGVTEDRPAKHETWWAPSQHKGMSCCCKHPDAFECGLARFPCEERMLVRCDPSWDHDEVACECCCHEHDWDDENWGDENDHQ